MLRIELSLDKGLICIGKCIDRLAQLLTLWRSDSKAKKDVAPGRDQN